MLCCIMYVLRYAMLYYVMFILYYVVLRDMSCYAMLHYVEL